ncbi:MAG TPA: helix-turn-helix domain-containing protein [Chlamydiales bacterium]|nr:helix-turn-helix domain-containing protein [Chlamydiales bacterium]
MCYIKEKDLPMNRLAISEQLLIESIAQAADNAKKASKGLLLGSLIKMIRVQLGMSQKVLAKRAGVPQSTISRIEKGAKDSNLSTLNKILEALSCYLVMVPMLREPLDTIRRKQAKKRAEAHMRYLRGTMNLEKQQPDSRLLNELFKQEEERLLQDHSSELWEE